MRCLQAWENAECVQAGIISESRSGVMVTGWRSRRDVIMRSGPVSLDAVRAVPCA